MKNTIAITVLAAIASAVACTPAAPDSTVPSNLVYRQFEASISPATRTSLSGTQVLWDLSGEQISMLDSQGNSYTLDQTGVDEGRTNATFGGDVPESGLVYAVYPASESASCSGGSVSLAIPSQQSATPASFAPGANVAISKVTAEKLYFKNIGGLVGFTVNADNIRSIRFSATGSNGNSLTGAVKVNYSGTDPVCEPLPSGGNDYVELTGTIASGTKYWAVVAPGSYTGLRVVFTDASGRTATLTKDATFTVERSKAVSISPFTLKASDWDDYNPGGTAMLVYDEKSKGFAAGYGTVKDYTNDYGTWTICAFNNTTDKGFQIREGKVAYIGTPSFDGTITSVSITNNNDRSGKFYVCTSSGTTSIPTPNLSVAVSGNSTVTLDVSSLEASKVYIRADFVAVISAINLTWGAGGPAEPAVTTLAAESIGVADATLKASFSGIPTSPSAVAAFFRWGTSASNLNQTVYDNGFPTGTASGSFSAPLTGLSEKTTYYYRAVMTLGDGSDVEGEIMSFTTRSAQPSSSNGYLDCFEIPAVQTSGSMLSGNEVSGRGYKWFKFNTTNSRRAVATHTFQYGGKVLRSYSVMLDGDTKAPVWCAFAMNRNVWPNNKVGRNDGWTKDPAFDTGWQQDGIGDPYSKGHLVASNYLQTSVEQNKQTFYLSNQAAQWQTQFNDGIWNNMEQRIAAIAPTTATDTLYIAIGVLYEGYIDSDDVFHEGSPTYIGTVPIPSHFYTCLMKCSFDASGNMTGASGCAYLFENRPYSGSYNNYKFTIDEVEQRAGLDFFHNVPDDLENNAEGQKASIL